MSLDAAIKMAREHGFMRIVPSTDLDSLIAASILSKNLGDRGVTSPVNVDPKVIIDRADEPSLLLNLSNPKKRGAHELKYTGEFSLAGYVARYLDRVFGISNWDKALSIVAGVYRGLDRGREGFRGLEREILDELVRENYVGIDLGLRVWGWKKRSLATALHRTLLPYIPGYSGDLHRTSSVLKNILNVGDVSDVRGEQVLSFEESKLDRARAFLEEFARSIEILDRDARNKLLLKLIGFVYTVHSGALSLDLLECLGSLLLFSSLEFNNVVYITLTSHDPTIVPQIVAMYNSVVDEASMEISSIINSYLKRGGNIVEVSNCAKRPDIYIDIVDSLERLPMEKPLIVRNNGATYTSLREFTRLNRDIERAYSKCSEYQICVVNENGDLIEAQNI